MKWENKIANSLFDFLTCDISSIMASSSSAKPPVKLGSVIKKIDSPLAKYNNLGQLTCIVCNAVVKSEMVWTAHISGRQHRENVDALKKRKETQETSQFAKPEMTCGIKRKGDSQVVAAASPSKKGVPADFFDRQTASPIVKPVKSILKNANKSNSSTSNLELKEPTRTTKEPMDIETAEPSMAANCKLTYIPEEISNQSGTIPEGFFDDPKLDAKVRQVEYKDLVEEEWEKFQKEINEEVMTSNMIQEEDQEESTVERQLEEIEEQMAKWGRVLILEQKKEHLLQKLQTIRKSLSAIDEGSSSEEEADINDLFDWRSKTSR